MPSVSGDSITNNDIAYLRSTSAAGMRGGQGWVYVEASNDVEVCDSCGRRCAMPGASHTQVTASAAMMAITTAMKVLDL